MRAPGVQGAARGAGCRGGGARCRGCDGCRGGTTALPTHTLAHGIDRRGLGGGSRVSFFLSFADCLGRIYSFLGQNFFFFFFFSLLVCDLSRS